MKIKKTIHFLSTSWLILAIFYMLITALRQWGIKWWVIFTLSGHSLVLVSFLISIYLFAIYQGVVRKVDSAPEHPLSRTPAYMLLYDIAPVLGALAGCYAMLDVAENSSQVASMIAMGTFAFTFLFWVIIDPIIEITEMQMPDSKKLRIERLVKAKQTKLLAEQKHRDTIKELIELQAQQRISWQKQLIPAVEQLCGEQDNKQYNQTIIDLGMEAWQRGGSNCMLEVYDLINSKLKDGSPKAQIVKMLWNGIGNWKNIA